MPITRFETTEKLSKAVACGQFVFVSGQVPDNADADPYHQTLEALNKVEKYLCKAGCTRVDMLFAMIFVKDLANLPDVNRAWSDWLPEGSAPARACVEATPASSQFELQVFAVGQRLLLSNERL